MGHNKSGELEAMEIDGAEEKNPVVETSDLNLGTRAQLEEHSAGSAKKAGRQISDSDGQLDSSKVIAQVPDGSSTEKDISVLSTNTSDNKKFPRTLKEPGTSEASTAAVEASFSDPKGLEQTSESVQTAPLADHAKAIKKLRNDKKRSNEQVRKLRNNKVDLGKEIAELRNEIQALKKEREEREARFQEAQKDALKLLKRDAIDALPDDEVRNEFKQVFAGSRQWTGK